MGTYLLIRKDGRTVAHLNNIGFYYDGYEMPEREEIWANKNDLVKQLTEKISTRIGYTPKNVEELEELTQETRESIEYYCEELVKLGRQDMLDELRQEGFELTTDDALEYHDWEFETKNIVFRLFYKETFTGRKKKLKLEIRPKVKKIQTIEEDVSKILSICKKVLPNNQYLSLEKELFMRFT